MLSRYNSEKRHINLMTYLVTNMMSIKNNMTMVNNTINKMTYRETA